MPDCLERIYSNIYADYIFEYRGSREDVERYFEEDCIQIINERYAVAYIERERNLRNQMLFDRGISYNMMPKCFGLMDDSSMGAAGISAVSDRQIYGYKGNGCIICVIDTGIDYTSPIFINEDGTSRILAIWDQTIEAGPPPEMFAYGAEYSREQINEALRSESPLMLVPSEDTVGHGTFLASVAAGNVVQSEGFRGAAPEADILVVKLKEAKPYLKWIYGIADDKKAYQENDIMAALAYAIQFAGRRKQPISVCIGLGTASGPHTGDLPLSQMVDSNSMATDVFISVAAGNEGNARLHYKGAGEKSIVEFNVGMEEEILVMELWGQAPDIYSISFETPDGVTVERIPPRFNGSERIQFAIGSTVLQVSYTLVEAQSGNELIYIWMYKPLPGVWKLHVRGEGRVTQFFNIWMQLSQYVRPDTYFLEPMPDITLTSPGDNENATTVTEYDHRTNSISLGASRGFTADDRIKPDLAAPGVNILGMGRRGYYERRSGTSISAAHVAGAACLMQQWSKDNLASPLTGIQIRRYLIGGAKRADNISWPSRLWGWGQLDLLEVFDSLRRNV